MVRNQPPHPIQVMINDHSRLMWILFSTGNALFIERSNVGNFDAKIHTPQREVTTENIKKIQIVHKLFTLYFVQKLRFPDKKDD